MKYEEIDVSLIRLDPENPRIADLLGSKTFDSIENQNEVIQSYLRGDTGNEENGPSANELEKSIYSSKGIIEPIILQRIGQDDYLCVEGNTRLSIYRHFIEKYPDEVIWNNIPSLVHDHISQDKIHELRLQAHFVGKKEWTPYAKGKYITLLVNNGTGLAKIKEIVGGSDAKTRANYYAYKVFKESYEPLFNPDRDNVFPEKTKFSMFVTVPEGGKIALALEYQGLDINDYAQWVKSNKVDSANDVRRFLEKVLINKEVYDVFIKKDKTLKDVIPLLPNDQNLSTVALKDASISQLCDMLTDTLLQKNMNNKIKSIRAEEGEAAVDSMYLLKEELISALDKLEEKES
jgi:hypothetical protein|tara:strand:+ start:167 stop:1207 length:1041 start_codon:yes stop_codon:yes gene_type:complete